VRRNRARARERERGIDAEEKDAAGGKKFLGAARFAPRADAGTLRK
jgi:hypothetical protein